MRNHHEGDIDNTYSDIFHVEYIELTQCYISSVLIYSENLRKRIIDYFTTLTHLQMATYRVSYKSGTTKNITVDLETVQGIYVYYRLHSYCKFPFTLSLVNTNLSNCWTSNVPCEDAYNSFCVDPSIFTLDESSNFLDLRYIRLAREESVPSGQRYVYRKESHDSGAIRITSSNEAALKNGIRLMDELREIVDVYVTCDLSANNTLCNIEVFSRLDGLSWNDLPAEVQEKIASVSPSTWMCVSSTYYQMLFPLLIRGRIQDDRRPIIINTNRTEDVRIYRITEHYSRLASILWHFRQPTDLQKQYVLRRLGELKGIDVMVLRIEPIIHNMFDPKIIDAHIGLMSRVVKITSLMHAIVHTNFQYLKRMNINILRTQEYIDFLLIQMNRDKALEILTSLQYLWAKHNFHPQNFDLSGLLLYLDDVEVQYILENMINGFGEEYIMRYTYPISKNIHRVRISRIMVHYCKDISPRGLLMLFASCSDVSHEHVELLTEIVRHPSLGNVNLSDYVSYLVNLVRVNNGMEDLLLEVLRRKDTIVSKNTRDLVMERCSCFSDIGKIISADSLS